jgi:hypothetical protein
MKQLFATLVTLLLLASADAQRITEPKWLPPLIEGGAPDCPDHRGSRESRSAVAVSPGKKATAYIAGTADHAADSSCRQKATLVVSESGRQTQITLQTVNRAASELKQDSLDAPDPIRSYALIDFSADGRSILVERTGVLDWRKQTFRDVDVAILELAKPDEPTWSNVWDLMHWGDCNATVEAQGFDKNSKPVLRVRPSVWSGHPKPDCVAKPELWEVNLKEATSNRLADDTLIPHNAVETGVGWASCKRDPDIVGACFTVHGRLSYWNGAPSLRISRIGTRRILGVHTETAPENVPKLWGEDVFATDIYGDFNVCPFTKEKPGHMQMVCIESASHLIAKQR